jgi:hypothetical protein
MNCITSCITGRMEAEASNRDSFLEEELIGRHAPGNRLFQGEREIATGPMPFGEPSPGQNQDGIDSHKIRTQFDRLRDGLQEPCG